MLRKEKENSAQSLAKFQPEATKTVTFTIEGENGKKIIRGKVSLLFPLPKLILFYSRNGQQLLSKHLALNAPPNVLEWIKLRHQCVPHDFYSFILDGYDWWGAMPCRWVCGCASRCSEWAFGVNVPEAFERASFSFHLAWKGKGLFFPLRWWQALLLFSEKTLSHDDPGWKCAQSWIKLERWKPASWNDD